jgi:glycosyltransferase involved in cell wall biosynthesis
VKIKRVLHLPNTLAKESGIVSSIMNYYRFIDRTKIQFDFLCFETDKSTCKDEIEAMGGRVYYIPETKNIIKFNRYVEEFFKESSKEYIAVHYHAISIWNLALGVAKKHGLKHRIVHSHATVYADKPLNAIRNRIMCLPIKKQANLYFACSKAAGEFMYGKKYIQKDRVYILNNAIDVDKFKYDEQIRKSIREDLNIEDKYVVCHIGRFAHQKNHSFLVEIFKEIKKIHDNTVLLLIGDGILKDNIMQQVIDLGISEDVKFLGMCDDVHNMLQAADVFLLPSFFEGLGIVLIEAQAAGVPCIASDVVPEEAKASDLIEFVSLSEKARIWAEIVIKYVGRNRTNTVENVRNAGFDIKLEVINLEKFYLDLK